MTEQIEKLPEEKTPEVNRKKPCAVIIFFFLLAVILLIGAMGYGYFSLSKINLSLAKNVAELQTGMTANKNNLSDLQHANENMQQTIQKAQDLSAQQEKLISDWKQAQLGDTDKWKVAQAEFLTNMAQEYLQFTDNTKLALQLLQRAHFILENLTDPNVMLISKTLALDITNLQAIQQVDKTALLLQLQTLMTQLNKLPLPKTALPEDTQVNMTVFDKNLPWWKASLQYAGQALQKIVIVRRSDNANLPLVLPEQKQWLYQNLHAQIENAVWGLLHNDITVYQSSLMQAQTWTKEYFVQEAQETKDLLRSLDELQKVKLEINNYKLENTLKQFDSYFSQIKTAQ